MGSKWGLSSGACASMPLTHKETIQGERSARATESLSLFRYQTQQGLSLLLYAVLKIYPCDESEWLVSLNFCWSDSGLGL